MLRKIKQTDRICILKDYPMTPSQARDMRGITPNIVIHFESEETEPMLEYRTNAAWELQSGNRMTPIPCEFSARGSCYKIMALSNAYPVYYILKNRDIKVMELAFDDPNIHNLFEEVMSQY